MPDSHVLRVASSIPNDVTFDDLQTLLVFSATEYLPAAADSLGRSVPTIQRSLRRLERAIGVPLFERTGRRLHLRAAGHVLAEQAARILRMRADAVDMTLSSRPEHRPVLRIAHTYSSGISMVPRVIAEYTARNPTGAVRLRQGSANSVVLDVLRGNSDIAFTSAWPLEPDIHVYPVLRDGIVLATSRVDAVGARTIDLDEFRASPFISMAPGSNSRELLLRACVRSGFSPRIVMTADNLFTVVSLVATGIGVAVLPRLMSEYRHPGVTFSAIKEDIPTTRTINTVFSNSSTQLETLKKVELLAVQYARGVLR